jgi:hypothetical protein
MPENATPREVASARSVAGQDPPLPVFGRPGDPEAVDVEAPSTEPLPEPELEPPPPPPPELGLVTVPVRPPAVDEATDPESEPSVEDATVPERLPPEDVVAAEPAVSVPVTSEAANAGRATDRAIAIVGIISLEFIVRC